MVASGPARLRAAPGFAPWLSNHQESMNTASTASPPGIGRERTLVMVEDQQVAVLDQRHERCAQPDAGSFWIALRMHADGE